MLQHGDAEINEINLSLVSESTNNRPAGSERASERAGHLTDWQLKLSATFGRN